MMMMATTAMTTAVTATMTIESIRFEEMSFAYEGQPPIFTRMNLDLPLGCNVLVTGPAGNGQSTFLRLLAGLLMPTDGRLVINGQNVSDMSFEEFQPFRGKIGYTFEYGGLFANRTLLDNLTLPLLYHKIFRPDEADDIARGLARQFKFERQLDTRPAAVSGGLRKLVCVLRAFLLRPQLMVMDDPFTGLDAGSARGLIDLIRERREAGELRHVFFTSRDEVWPGRIGHDILLIENGTPRFVKTPKIA